MAASPLTHDPEQLVYFSRIGYVLEDAEEGEPAWWQEDGPQTEEGGEMWLMYLRVRAYEGATEIAMLQQELVAYASEFRGERSVSD